MPPSGGFAWVSQVSGELQREVADIFGRGDNAARARDRGVSPTTMRQIKISVAEPIKIWLTFFEESLDGQGNASKERRRVNSI
jgi:hypothetical protein